jgi:tyrosyl-tRNA synthetase
MDKLEQLLTRGVDKIYPSCEELEKVLRSGKKLKLYQGFDPTGNQLHIGHMIGLRKLAQWQALGHEVIFLIGDFTAMVGDPSGKTTARKMLDEITVKANTKSYIEQAGRILKFTGENPVKVLYNSSWLATMSAIDFFRIAGLLSVNQVIERDLFQVRQKEGNDIYMNEFLYPVMQAYDSVHMNVDLEIGGTDQMFNMLMGRKLMRHMLKKDKFVITTPLLTDSAGNKIGKSEGNVIGLSDKPEELYAKIMGLSDNVIIKAMEYLTDIPMVEIKEIEKKLKDGQNPILFKKMLAYEIVKDLNSEENAGKAEDSFKKVVQEKEVPDDIETLRMTKNNPLSKFVIEQKLVESMGEWKRLIEQHGVTIDEERIENPFINTNDIKNGGILRIGKRRYAKIVKAENSK